MIGIVIIGHGQLGEEFVKVAEHIMEHQPQLLYLRVDAEDDVEARREELLAAINTIDTGDGVVVLTDMFGGTPSNIALSLLDVAKIEIIAGFNLPLLIKLLTVRKDRPLHEAVIEAQSAGQKNIHVATQVLGSPPQALSVNE